MCPEIPALSFPSGPIRTLSIHSTECFIFRRLQEVMNETSLRLQRRTTWTGETRPLLAALFLLSLSTHNAVSWVYHTLELPLIRIETPQETNSAIKYIFFHTAPSSFPVLSLDTYVQHYSKSGLSLPPPFPCPTGLLICIASLRLLSSFLLRDKFSYDFCRYIKPKFLLFNIPQRWVHFFILIIIRIIMYWYWYKRMLIFLCFTF